MIFLIKKMFKIIMIIIIIKYSTINTKNQKNLNYLKMIMKINHWHQYFKKEKKIYHHNKYKNNKNL